LAWGNVSELTYSVGVKPQFSLSFDGLWLFRRNKFEQRTPAGGDNRAKPAAGPSPQSAAAQDEVEQQKKLAQRARRFAAPPPAKTPTTPDGRELVRPGTKRPSDQGLESASGQSSAKQMRLLASRRVVAKARATVVQQQQQKVTCTLIALRRCT